MWLEIQVFFDEFHIFVYFCCLHIDFDEVNGFLFHLFSRCRRRFLSGTSRKPLPHGVEQRAVLRPAVESGRRSEGVDGSILETSMPGTAFGVLFLVKHVKHVKPVAFEAHSWLLFLTLILKVAICKSSSKSNKKSPTAPGVIAGALSPARHGRGFCGDLCRILGEGAGFIHGEPKMTSLK